MLDDVQAAPIAKPDVTEEWITVAADVGDVRVRVVKPVDATGALPTILYMHGGGWVLGLRDSEVDHPARVRPRASTRRGWRWPATRSAAT